MVIGCFVAEFFVYVTTHFSAQNLLSANEIDNDYAQCTTIFNTIVSAHMYTKSADLASHTLKAKWIPNGIYKVQTHFTQNKLIS